MMISIGGSYVEDFGFSSIKSECICRSVVRDTSDHLWDT
jgi:hypothetical protein